MSFFYAPEKEKPVSVLPDKKKSNKTTGSHFVHIVSLAIHICSTNNCTVWVYYPTVFIKEKMRVWGLLQEVQHNVSIRKALLVRVVVHIFFPSHLPNFF